ncbi:hypothetical protein SteCoe_34683 [Stentor coeruleus]|uniref:Uncharacterized protein n=1 Tax=Stentor coeruleus TaxID=5963 RepID=A0A1R2AU73_9CILI|nr:hypothetical protein SteCoe_34683 [Stentor coeruleus]
MVKRCLMPNCDRKVAFVCGCKGNPIFMCKKHPTDHLISKGNHDVVGLLYKPDDQETKEINKIFFDNLLKIRKIKDQTLENTKKIIEHTLQLSSKLLGYLGELENLYLNMYKNIKSHKEIDIQDVENFKNLADFDESFIFKNTEVILENLISNYDIDPCANAEKALFFNILSSSKLFTLNLESFVSSPFDLLNEKEVEPSLNIDTEFSLCKVEKQKYCLISAPYAFLIDMKQNQIDLLPNISSSSKLCGLVYKDQYIYAFGTNGQSSCKLKISTMSWINISSLPYQNNVSYNYYNLGYAPPQNNIGIQGTASFINNNIVIASSNLNGLYHYDENSNSYAKVIELNQNSYNYAMENWIVSSDGKLYENIGPLLSDFKNYKNFMAINLLSVYSSFLSKGTFIL